jgi:hypothetical protein
MLIIGIDPGKNGSICVLNSETKMFVDIEKMMETPKDINDFFLKYKGTEVFAYLELVGGIPGNGSSASFNFGKGYGHLEMALLANNIPFETVTPQKWQKIYQIGTTKSRCSSPTEWKNILKAKCQQLFPSHKIFLWNSDAMLIAEYGRRTVK